MRKGERLWRPSCLKENIIGAKLFVGNLNFDTTKEELEAVFSEVGQIVDCFLPKDRETGRPRGFAFVEFADPSSASEAVTKFDGLELGGRNLRVNEADERRRGPGPGGPPSGARGPGGGYGGRGGGPGGGRGLSKAGAETAKATRSKRKRRVRPSKAKFSPVPGLRCTRRCLIVAARAVQHRPPAVR